MNNNFNLLQLEIQKLECLLMSTVTDNFNSYIDYLKIKNLIHNKALILDEDETVDEHLTFNKNFIYDIIEFSYKDIKHEYKENTVPYSKEKIADLTNDFYKKYLNEYYYNIFNNIYKHKKNNLKFTNRRSYSQYLSTLNYSYINIENKENFDTLLNLVHEYGHAVQDYICFKNPNKEYPFTELTSIFFELLSIDFFNTNESYNAKLNMYTAMKKCAVYLRDIYVNNNKSSQNKITGYEQYALSYLTSLELYFQFQEDKELALNNLFKLIISNTPKQSLTNNNIFLNEHLNDYVKIIEKKI